VSKKQVQKILANGTYLFSNVLKNCDFVRSYATGFNKGNEVVDNDFGDLIIADLNFDGKDDFALKKDSGGNGGPVYNFYVQNNGKFILDKFLTEQMEFFPTRINKNNKTLTTFVHANAYQLGEHTYRFAANKWKETKHKLIKAY
jgi:hypothetical protein